MINEYETLKSFWNSSLKNDNTDVYEGKWVEDDTFNNSLLKYIREGSRVLDYGCGSGWGLIEISYSVKIASGLGIDTSENAISYCKRCAQASKIENIDFVAGDESLLKQHQNEFDCIFSINLIDVIPDEIINSVLEMWDYCLRDNGYIIVGINPDFPKEFLNKIGFALKDRYLYKDNVMRGNDKTTEEWKQLLSSRFELVEFNTFALVEREKEYPRRMFVLRKKTKKL